MNTDEKISQILDLYDQDKLVEAYVKLKTLDENIVEGHRVLSQIVQDYLETRELMQEFLDEKDWVVENDGNVQVCYKKVPGTPTISMKCESVIEVPIFNFISLVYETDLYPDWVPFCRTCRTVERVSKSKKIIFSEFDVVKIAKRAICLVGYGYNLLHTDGIVMIVSKSVDYSYPTNYTLAKLNFFGCLIRPLSENSIHVKLISNFDPNIYFLPYSLLNWVVRKVSKTIFKKMTEKCKKFENSEYPQRMLLPENIEFYQHLQRSMDEYLEKLKQDNK